VAQAGGDGFVYRSVDCFAGLDLLTSPVTETSLMNDKIFAHVV
jgi:hypothetical protein